MLSQNLSKTDEKAGQSSYETHAGNHGTIINDYYVDEKQDMQYQFENVSFAEVANLFEHYSMNSYWDTRENGDFQTVLLARRHMFYGTESANYTINTSGKLLNEIYIQPNSVPLSPIEFFIEFQNKLTSVNPELDNEPDIPTIQQSKILHTNVNFKDGLKQIVHRNKCRKYSENHFAISKINLISHNIATNESVINSVTFPITNQDKDSGNKMVLSILNDPNKEHYHMKSLESGVELLGQELSPSNTYVQIESSATALLKELELVYQGRIFMLYNKDIQMNDTITLIDEPSSIYGIFKVESFEHILDNRGLITVADVTALWDIKDPTLDHFSINIGYKLLSEFANRYGINDETVDNHDANEEITENNIIQNIYGTFLKTLTQNIKYCSLILRYELAEELQMSGASFNNLLVPTPLPVRFFPMIRKGKAEIPASLESAFFNSYSFGNHKNLFTRFVNLVSRKFIVFTRSVSIEGTKILRFVGDTLISVFTLNLHELFKGMLGVTSSKARKAVTDNTYVGSYEFESSKTRYNPFNNKPLGREYKMSIAFFNTRLQTVKDLYDGEVSNMTFFKDDVLKRIQKKEKLIKDYITNIFDYTLLVELYDGFNGKETEQLHVDGLEYSYLNFVQNIIPDNSSFYSITGKLMSNEHGSEYGAVVGKTNRFYKFTGSSSDTANPFKEEHNRHYHKVTFDVPESELFANGIQKITIFFFHALYGVAKQKEKNVQNARSHFITTVIKEMESYLKMHKDHGVVLMADCNVEIVNKTSNAVFTPASSSQNLVYYLNSNLLTSKIHNKTSLSKSNIVNNVFDNIVVSKNIEDYVVCSTYNYPYEQKREVSDHIPVYLGIK